MQRYEYQRNYIITKYIVKTVAQLGNIMCMHKGKLL